MNMTTNQTVKVLIQIFFCFEINVIKNRHDNHKHNIECNRYEHKQKNESALFIFEFVQSIQAIFGHEYNHKYNTEFVRIITTYVRIKMLTIIILFV